MSYAITPHGVDRIDTVSPHFSGTLEPESLGLVGGYPGAMNAAMLLRGSGVSGRLSAGTVPAVPDDLDGHPELLPGVAAVALRADDVLLVRATGGGGFGDPIEREPEDVARDVRAQLVGVAEARDVYGVVTDGSGIDPGATRQRREQMRQDRLLRTSGAGVDGVPELPDVDPVRRTPAGWALDTTPGGSWSRCLRCGHAEPVADPDQPLSGFPGLTCGLDSAGSYRDASTGNGFGLVERICPSCARLLDVDRIRLPGDRADA